MIDYIEFLNVPMTAALLIIGLFLIMQLIGEILEFKGKIVPEVMKVRKIFARRKREHKTMEEVSVTLANVNKSLDEMNKHYSTDNIQMRDAWMKLVNDKLEQYDENIGELSRKLDQNNRDTLSLLVESKRSAIINFASVVIDENRPVTREQFNRIFKIHREYDTIIKEHEMTNGEVDIAIRIIKEAYEAHMRNHSFLEDVRGYSSNPN